MRGIRRDADASIRHILMCHSIVDQLVRRDPLPLSSTWDSRHPAHSSTPEAQASLGGGLLQWLRILQRRRGPSNIQLWYACMVSGPRDLVEYAYLDLVSLSVKEMNNGGLITV